MPNFRFEHPDLRANKAAYTLIDDAIAGEAHVKNKNKVYLPQPNAADQSPANGLRYDAYLLRAVFYNVTRRTLGGLLGSVFEVPPVEELPDELDKVRADASGGGVTLEQVARRAARDTLAKGRAGMFVDFPETPPGGITKQDTDEGKFQPTITVYNALDIINWRVDEIVGKDKLTLVVLKEPYIVSDDGFQQTKKWQYRSLHLTNGVYTAKIWRDAIDKPFKEFNGIVDAAGKPLSEIPFTFIGSENNDADVDDAPMYDLASLNMAHYRNSADYEEACYIVGQPTPYFAGITEAWAKEIFGGGIVELGSRAAIPLPEGGTAGLLQATETTMAFQAMEHKERQMVALGAKIVQQTETQRTATETKIENKSETSILGNVSRNTSAGVVFCLKKCMLFLVGGKDEDYDETVKYELNTKFGLADMSPEELSKVIEGWQNNAISFTEMRTRLRIAGLATIEDKTAKAEIETDLVAADARETKKLAEQGTKATDEAIRLEKAKPSKAA